MADLLGSAATAALLRRSLKGLGAGDLGGELRIERDGLDYHYSLPPSWSDPSDERALAGFRQLLRHLVPILVGLTGTVVVRSLIEHSSLRAHAILPAEEVERWLSTH